MVGTVVIAVTAAVTVNEVWMAKKRALRRAVLRTPDQVGTITERLSEMRSGLDRIQPRQDSDDATKRLKEQQTC